MTQDQIITAFKTLRDTIPANCESKEQELLAGSLLEIIESTVLSLHRIDERLETLHTDLYHHIYRDRR